MQEEEFLKNAEPFMDIRLVFLHVTFSIKFMYYIIIITINVFSN